MAYRIKSVLNDTMNSPSNGEAGPVSQTAKIAKTKRATTSGSKSICDLACEILQKTQDGDDLAPEHLKLLEMTVNGRVNEKGEVAFYALHKSVMDGYARPWFHGIEHMTQDHEGYIYWRGEHVEHYSFRDYDDEDKAAKELQKRCQILEAKGIKPTGITAIWKWDESYAGEAFDDVNQLCKVCKERPIQTPAFLCNECTANEAGDRMQEAGEAWPPEQMRESQP